MYGRSSASHAGQLKNAVNFSAWTGNGCLVRTGKQSLMLSPVKVEEQGEVAAGLLEGRQSADVLMGVSHWG